MFFLAAFGCLIAALFLGWLLQPEKPNLPGDSGYREQAASYRAGGSDCEPSKVRALPVRLRSRKADACAEAEERHREATNNIIAVRRSARAADASAIVSYQQARIAAWGFGAGIVTLLAAIAAAVFAERAAFHTKSGSESYRAREEASLLPMIIVDAYTVHGFAKNVGPTKAIMLIANSTIFPDPPPNPVPFIFTGHGRFSVGIEGNSQYNFGTFNANTPVCYFVGGIIYETVFGDVRFMRAAFRINRLQGSWDVYTDLDWSLWEREAEKTQRQKKRFT